MRAEGRPRVLVLVAEPEWSVDLKSRAIQRCLAHRFDVVVRYHHELVARELDEADVVLVHYWFQLHQLVAFERALLRNRHKLALGVVGMTNLDAAFWARMHEQREPPPGAPGYYEPAFEHFRRYAAVAFGVSRDLCDVLRAELELPVFFVPNGVDTRLFAPAERTDDGPLRVGWAGSLDNLGPGHRGVREFIEPAVRGLQGVELVTAAREERWRPHAEMPAFYGGIDVYVCASHTEGAPNPCLEAAATGAILVSTPVGVMPDLIVDGVNGFLVERSVEAIAQRLRELRDDTALRGRLRAAMAGSILEWSWEKRALGYAEMFDALLAMQGGPRPPAPEPTPPPLALDAQRRARVVALLGTCNDELLVGPCIEHLLAQDVEVYVLDAESADATREIASRYAGRGLIGLEVVGGSILERKEELAAELDADWFLHLDVDALPLPPDDGGTLAEALGAAQHRRFNAVSFEEDGADPASFPGHVLAWLKGTEPVQLRWSEGRRAAFLNLRLAPWPFRLRRATREQTHPRAAASAPR